jgi:hypothetical protein
MHEEEKDARWQEIVDARVDFGDESAPELRAVGSSATPRRASSKSEEFNEALSDLGSWSTVESSRRRMSA